jgi:hypothetical protein
MTSENFAAIERSVRRRRLYVRTSRTVYTLAAAGIIAAIATYGASAASTNPSSANATATFSHITKLERQVLKHRSVSFAGYELATDATVACLRHAGFHVSNPAPASNGLLMYTADYSFGSSQPSQQQQNRVDRADASCTAESSAVQAVYILDHAPSAAQLRRGITKSVQCLESAGIRLPKADQTASSMASVMPQVRAAIRSSRLTIQEEQNCLAPYFAVDIQPLPGLGQALASLSNP